jgi:multiple sugar transport system permease protein
MSDSTLSDESVAIAPRPVVARKGWWRKAAPFLLISPAHLLLVTAILLPALYVAWLSLHESSYGSAPEFVGLKNYAQAVADPAFWGAFWNTFFIVNVVAYTELVLGTAMAVYLVSGVPFPRTTMCILLAPYAVSEVVNAVMWKSMLAPQTGALQWLLRSAGLPEVNWTADPTIGLSVIALMAVWHHLPFTVLILYAALLNIPKELYEAARLDGANRLQEFWLITLRLLMPALLVALIFRYIFAFRIFSEVWLMTQGGPARTTEVLSVYLYNAAFRYDEFGLASAVAWIMTVLGFLISIPYLYLMFRRNRQDA